MIMHRTKIVHCRIVNVHKCDGNVCCPYAGPEKLEGVDDFLGFHNVLCFPKFLELTTS